MATTTPNFGWPVPTSTDLVKDGATAIEALGDGIDASLVDLKGGTTGQILAKATAADMDFAWVTNDVGDITAVTAGTGISGGGTSGAVTVTNSMATEIAAKGDLIVGTGSQTFDNLTAGANGQTIVANSSASTGLSYSSNAPLGGMSLLNAGGTALTGAATITISGISNCSRITIVMDSASSVNATSAIGLRFNADTGTRYGYAGFFQTPAGVGLAYSRTATSIPFAATGNDAANVVRGIINLNGAFSAGYTQYSLGSTATGAGYEAYNFTGFYDASAQITSVSLISSSGNFDAGTIYVYGA
jgi:hypothetical protein